MRPRVLWILAPWLSNAFCRALRRTCREIGRTSSFLSDEMTPGLQSLSQGTMLASRSEMRHVRTRDLLRTPYHTTCSCAYALG